MNEQTAAEQVARLLDLRAPFPPEAINQLPKGNTTLDYVSHAHATERLLDVDPLWTWEPVAFDADGLPQLAYDKNGSPVGLWIRLTVCGVTRLGYGSCASGKGEAIKELIGDALRNAAMRFGVALDLWKKEVPTPQNYGQASSQERNGQHRPQSPHNGTPRGGDVASENQVNAIHSLTKKIWGNAGNSELLNHTGGAVPREMTKGEASKLIGELQGMIAQPPQ